MTGSVKLGIQDLSVPQGTHLCGFFWGRERGDLVFPYLREGLRSGEKCLCAFDGPDFDAVRAEVSAEVEVPSAGDQLDVVLSSDIYLGRGEFTVSEMLDYWDTWAAASLAGGGFSAARIVGEMTWAVTEIIGPANLTSYESELNRFVPRYPQVMLCLYDLDRFRGDLIVAIMRTHPKVLMGSTVLENLYYVPPDQLVTTPR
jgi:DcmR-like sensory protein